MIKKIIFLVLIIGLIWFVAEKFTIKPSVHSDSLDFINLPQGFNIEVFADDLRSSRVSTPGPNNGPRLMSVKDDIVFVAIPSKGEIIVLQDKDKDNKVESRTIFISGLNNPHNVAFFDDWVYMAEEDKVIRVKDANKDNVADLETKEKLVDLPSGSHWTRTVKIFDNNLFISIGSSCNVCLENDRLRTTIQKCDLDGKNCKTFASGLRNSVDFIRYNNKIYAADNGRDGLGNDLPPEEINIIEEGRNYGWPFCYGNNIRDKKFIEESGIKFEMDPCSETEPPFVELQAHSAPLGLDVYTGNKFPEEYRNKLFVAYHGSWDRDPPTGYKVVTVDLNTKEVKDFATGWLSSAVVRGRPVGVVNFRESLLISDDNAGKIYRIYYENEAYHKPVQSSLRKMKGIRIN